MTKIVGYTKFHASRNRWDIKLSDGKFHNYARYKYEKAFGEQPKDYIVVYINGDPRDISLDNLYMISRRQSVYIRANKLSYTTKNELKTMCLLADLSSRIPHYVRPSRRKQATS